MCRSSRVTGISAGVAVALLTLQSAFAAPAQRDPRDFTPAQSWDEQRPRSVPRGRQVVDGAPTDAGIGQAEGGRAWTDPRTAKEKQERTWTDPRTGGGRQDRAGDKQARPDPGSGRPRSDQAERQPREAVPRRERRLVEPAPQPRSRRLARGIARDRTASGRIDPAPVPAVSRGPDPSGFTGGPPPFFPYAPPPRCPLIIKIGRGLDHPVGSEVVSGQNGCI